MAHVLLYAISGSNLNVEVSRKSSFTRQTLSISLLNIFPCFNFQISVSVTTSSYMYLFGYISPLLLSFICHCKLFFSFLVLQDKGSLYSPGCMELTHSVVQADIKLMVFLPPTSWANGILGLSHCTWQQKYPHCVYSFLFDVCHCYRWGNWVLVTSPSMYFPSRPSHPVWVVLCGQFRVHVTGQSAL